MVWGTFVFRPGRTRKLSAQLRGQSSNSTDITRKADDVGEFSPAVGFYLRPASMGVPMQLMIFAPIGALVAAFLGETAQAYEAPWCAMIENGKGSVYWDCQYRSFEDCYRRGNI